MTRSPISTVFAVLLLVLFAVRSEAQSALSLIGTVADENGVVVINAHVQASNITSGRAFNLSGGDLSLYSLEQAAKTHNKLDSDG